MGKVTKFSVWMRTNLKDAFSGLITQDIDFILTNNEDRYFIVEEKNYARARTGPAQAIIYKMIDEFLSEDPIFLGCHKATLVHDGIWLDQTGKVSIDEFMTNPNAFEYNQYGQKWFEKVLYFSMNSLWDGKGTPPIRKTENEHTFNRDSLIENELSRRNIRRARIDWIFVNYVSGYFALFSESNCFDDPIVQRIIQFLENSNKTVRNPKSNCVYKFLGAYQIDYNNDMSKFCINNYEMDVADAIRILNLDTNEILNCK
jgi:hypothetical protein